MALRDIIQRLLSFVGMRPGNHVDDDPTLAYIRRGDPEMTAAWQEARANVPQFLRLLEDPEYGDAEFYVKKRFDDGQQSEHIWLSDVRVEGDQFIGSVGNDPRIVTNAKFGEEAQVAMDDISDWMITRGEEMIGGFTVELLMQRRG